MTATIHLAGPIDPWSLRVSRGVTDVVVHVDQEDGSVDTWLVTREDGPRSMGVASSVLGCGCP